MGLISFGLETKWNPDIYEPAQSLRIGRATFTENSVWIQYKISRLELISLINLIKWFGSLLTYIITLAYSHFRHYHSNSTRDIKVNNFLHDLWIHHKISKLGLRSLTSLLFKWVELGLTYIILYFCSDRIRAQYMNTNYNPFICR
jgi:hypothetical protein